jgi:hypothetical protein
MYYDFNEYLILPQSIKTLYKIKYILLDHPDYNIQLFSYTDSRGSDAYNLKLSMRRAQSAKDFLIVEGIEASRITAKGFGETNLINNCVNGVECSDEEHSLNRRTEIKLLIK